MAPAERLHQTGCMDGVGLHGWRNGWPRKACIPGTGTVQCTVLFSTGKCTGSSGGGGATSRRRFASLTVIFRGALLNAGHSGVRTLGTGFTMMFTTAGHTRYTARHHSVGSGCGHLGSGRVQTPSEGEIHRLWLRYNAAEWWGFGGGGQQPQGHSRRAREPLRIESQLGFGALQASPIWSSRRPKYPHSRDERRRSPCGEIALDLECAVRRVRTRRRREKERTSAMGAQMGAHMVTSSLRWYATGKRRIDVFPTAMSTVFLRRQKTFSFI